jgi:endonuclease III
MATGLAAQRSLLKRSERRLRRAYGRPRHGNKSNALDELIFILLSRQTDDRSFSAAYRRLRREVGSWKNLPRLSTARIRRLVEAAGLGNQRAREIKQIARRLDRDFGSVTLSALSGMSTDEAEEYLLGLPGIGKKSARCILMYSLARPAFPVDTHCFRILNRLGVIEANLPIRQHEDKIQRLIPPSLRYSLHVTLVALGRDLCHSRTPRCAPCPIRTDCAYYRRTRERRHPQEKS